MPEQRGSAGPNAGGGSESNRPAVTVEDWGEPQRSLAGLNCCREDDNAESKVHPACQSCAARRLSCGKQREVLTIMREMSRRVMWCFGAADDSLQQFFVKLSARL